MDFRKMTSRRKTVSAASFVHQSSGREDVVRQNREASKAASTKFSAEDDGEAKDPAETALANLNSAADSIVAGVMAIQENLGSMETQTDEQKAAVEKIKDTVDNALAPYASDLLKELAVFDAEEE